MKPYHCYTAIVLAIIGFFSLIIFMDDPRERAYRKCTGVFYSHEEAIECAKVIFATPTTDTEKDE